VSDQFTLHCQLANDTVFLCDWPLSRVLLMDDSRFAWLILVPRREGISEFHQLSDTDRGELTQEIARAGEMLQSWAARHGGCDKLNIAMIGNIVPQLHVHVVARRKTDPHWPYAVWGRGEPVRYAAPDLQTMLAELARRFSGQ
jgi:diadenosine tetraphosphate (Ap4A) HIT family hydrolase